MYHIVNGGGGIGMLVYLQSLQGSQTEISVEL